MSDPSLNFLAPARVTSDTILALIGQRWSLSEEPSRTTERVFFDTFDWALFADGGILEWQQAPTGATLKWTPLDPEATPLSQPAPEEPAFAADLAPGPVREQILKPTGIRRLLPVMEIRSRSRTLRLLDEEDKTVLRIAVDEGRFHDPVDAVEGPLGVRLRVLPLRGYDAERDLALEIISHELGMEPAQRPELLEALAAAGRTPGDYSSKLDLHLDQQTRADQITKTIMLVLLETIERNIAGTRANLDSEFLHDLRVAVRRTRSALTQIRDVFPTAIVAHYKERFAWLQQITGPVRDLDVYLLDFDNYQQSLPASLRPDLEPLRVFILSHYDQEQRQLAEALVSQEFTDLLGTWRAFLDAPVPEKPEAPDADRPIKTLANTRILRMAKRVRKEGLAITDQSPDEDLHELRKSCKKLRYLMEFFQSLYPQTEIRGLIRTLKTLLDNLGRFQDLAVQAEHLRDLAARMRAEDQASTGTLLAMGALIGDLLTHQKNARHEFSAVFAEFQGEQTQAQIRSLFKTRSHTDGGRTVSSPEAAK